METIVSNIEGTFAFYDDIISRKSKEEATKRLRGVLDRLYVWWG